MEEEGNEFNYMKQLIAEYDVVVPEITEQLHYYKSEYKALKREIMDLSRENKVLYQKLEACASNEMALSSYSYKDNDFIDNLKNQLSLSLKEKESVVELWRTSMTRIDYLENELKLYSAGSDNINKNLIRKMKKTYEDEVRTLRFKLKESHHQLLEATSISKTSLAKKNDELETLNKTQEQLHSQIAALKEELHNSELKNLELQQLLDTLKAQLSKETRKLEQIKLENYNAKLKVAEACHIIEAALLEKDSALKREVEAKDEISKLSITINEIVHETEGKVKGEIFNVKEEFANKMHSYKLELKKSQEELAMKMLEVEKKNEMCRSLQREIEVLKDGRNKIIKSVSKEKLALSGKVEESKEKLVNSERKNTQLKQQIKNIQETLEKTKQQHKDATCKLEMNKKNLETKIHTLENELQMSHAHFHQVNAKVEDLSRRITSMNLQFKEELALKNAESERILTERLNEVECVNARINEELKSQLSAQISLNHKWKVEVRNVTAKLESKIRSLTNELAKARCKNNELVSKLEQCERKKAEYKENLKSLCTDFNSFANLKIE